MFCAHGIPQWGGDRVSRVASSSWNALVFFQLLSTKADNGALTSPLLPLPLLLPLPPSLPLRPFLPPPPLQCSPWTLSANSAAPSSFSAASSSSLALFFISAASSPFASVAFPATSSTAASTPLFISPSSPASPRRRILTPPLAFWTSPQITASFPLLLLFPLPPFLGVELRPNKILDSFFSR